jgi:hypothetical protein
MRTRSALRKSRTAFWLAGLVVVIGLAPVIYFVALSGWQWSTSIQAGKWIALPLTLAFSDHSLRQAGRAAPVLPYIPELPWIATPPVAKILDRAHVALIPALLGVLIMTLGVTRALRQRAVVRALRQHNEDRVRRIQDYRREDTRIERREPYIGTGSLDQSTDRRVA